MVESSMISFKIKENEIPEGKIKGIQQPRYGGEPGSVAD